LVVAGMAVLLVTIKEQQVPIQFFQQLHLTAAVQGAVE
jgi:hypothetical protein